MKRTKPKKTEKVKRGRERKVRHRWPSSKPDSMHAARKRSSVVTLNSLWISSQRERESERERVCVCVCERERNGSTALSSREKRRPAGL